MPITGTPQQIATIERLSSLHRRKQRLRRSIKHWIHTSAPEPVVRERVIYLRTPPSLFAIALASSIKNSLSHSLEDFYTLLHHKEAITYSFHDNNTDSIHTVASNNPIFYENAYQELRSNIGAVWAEPRHSIIKTSVPTKPASIVANISKRLHVRRKLF